MQQTKSEGEKLYFCHRRRFGAQEIEGLLAEKVEFFPPKETDGFGDLI